MFAYQPTDADEVLLTTYKANAKMIGMDGVPEPHLAGLQAVAREVEAKVVEQKRRDAALAGEVSPDAFLQVADHASVLAALVRLAVQSGAIRTEARVVLEGLDAALALAGYTEKNEFVGWRELPGRRLTVDVGDKSSPVRLAAQS
jgi:hypothetical protein